MIKDIVDKLNQEKTIKNIFEEKSTVIVCNYSLELRSDLRRNEDEFLELLEFSFLEHCKGLIQKYNLYIKNILFDTLEKRAIVNFYEI